MSIQENILYCDVNYTSYTLHFYLIFLAGYMLKKKKTVEYYSKYCF